MRKWAEWLIFVGLVGLLLYFVLVPAQKLDKRLIEFNYPHRRASH